MGGSCPPPPSIWAMKDGGLLSSPMPGDPPPSLQEKNDGESWPPPSSETPAPSLQDKKDGDAMRGGRGCTPRCAGSLLGSGRDVSPWTSLSTPRQALTPGGGLQVGWGEV